MDHAEADSAEAEALAEDRTVADHMEAALEVRITEARIIAVHSMVDGEDVL